MALPNMLLFCDRDGRVVEVLAHGQAPGSVAVGTMLWEALGLEGSGMGAFLERFFLGAVHAVDREDGESLALRVVALPETLCSSGYLVELIFSRQLGLLGDRLEVPATSTLKLNYAVFHAVFNDARDAILLTDEALRIVAANRKAQDLYGAGGSLEGKDCRRIFVSEDELRVTKKAAALRSGATWRAPVTTLGSDGQAVLAKLQMRCLSAGEIRLFQLMVRDLRRHMALERDLKKSRIEVAGMNIALKQVLRNVEEEKQELKNGLVQHMREEVLPTVERIVQEDSPLVRQAFRSALEERIADMGDDPSEALPSLVSVLSPREIDICRLIQQGWQGRAIAENLSISFETLQTHRKNIRRKLRLRGQSVSLAAYLGQLSPL